MARMVAPNRGECARPLQLFNDFLRGNRIQMTLDTRPILAAIDHSRPWMDQLLAALVAIPTENPPGLEYDACVDRLESAASSRGLWSERIAIESNPPRTALIASVGEGTPSLYFHGHYDVVPACTRDQFAPRQEGDTLFGRGSSDMKSGLVAMLAAADALRVSRARLNGRLTLLFVPDEETGGATGSARLAATGRLGRDGIGMLLPEPTSGRIWNGNRGAISLTVTVRGRSAHVGLMQQGVNAVERALPALERLFALKRDIDARGSLLLIGGRVEAGSNFNVVPDECRFSVDRRTNPDEDFDVEKQRLLETIRASLEGADATVDVFQEGRSSSTPIDHELGTMLRGAIEEVAGEAPIVEPCPGLLETRFYAERGVPAYAYGPGILAVSHGPNEFVKLPKVAECAKIYALTALRMLT
jgi:succinyl-diaminopimelate desuccinylase